MSDHFTSLETRLLRKVVFRGPISCNCLEHLVPSAESKDPNVSLMLVLSCVRIAIDWVQGKAKGLCIGERLIGRHGEVGEGQQVKCCACFPFAELHFQKRINQFQFRYNCSCICAYLHMEWWWEHDVHKLCIKPFTRKLFEALTLIITFIDGLRPIYMQEREWSWIQRVSQVSNAKKEKRHSLQIIKCTVWVEILVALSTSRL